MHLNRMLKTLLVTAAGALLADGAHAAPTLKGKDTTSFHVSGGIKKPASIPATLDDRYVKALLK